MKAPAKTCTLPKGAYLPINRCNLPAVILGSLTFQQHPAPLFIDGVRELHRELFARIERCPAPEDRARRFMDYMVVHFRLHALDEAGFSPHSRINRSRADYLRLLRGWSFDSEGRDGAVLKGWVESRFGLIPRYHGEPILCPDANAYRAYQQAFAEGVYNTNAIEAQLDLLYTYCQHELRRRYPEHSHLHLFRGSNGVEVLSRSAGREQAVVLFNNISSFSRNIERADEFGDRLFSADVPLSKIFFHANLLPGYLKAEEEFIVIGGVYQTKAWR